MKLDKKNVRKGLEAIGARQTDIVIVEDVSRKQISEVIQDLTAKIYENNSANVKTFIFLYYAGHGAMVNGQTVFVLNE